MTLLPLSETCWDLAVSLAAHHAGGHQVTAEPVERDIFQVSTISALMAGVLDGDTPYADVMRHGDFGVGTFNALDGEMAALDGNYYHLHTDGSVTDVQPSDLTPFAAVTFFRRDAEIDIGTPYDRAGLLELVDGTVPSTNLFYAIRVDGDFSSVTTRTAARQSKPYPSLAETTTSQVEHTLDSVSGTIVGFRAPQYAQGIAVAGYHLHFIDDSRTVGGHVLDFTMRSGRVTLDRDADLHVEMPTSASFLDADIDSGDSLGAAIEKAENAVHEPSDPAR
ncbi:MAG TPA: acetolactate decarboxylase [Mycobacteriales bacterium]|jgi:acetolactate decarboxylase|nr:acetolactate decarboxylase [Mycobacteriales bacterium]